MTTTQMSAPPSPIETDNYENRDKKGKLTTDEIEALERSFQEEIKLDPKRKQKLARELGIEPCQVAVWFQNRRARWKAKQLEHLYDALKIDYDLVSREKQKLEEEVQKLKAMLMDQATRKKFYTSYSDISGEETKESMSIGEQNCFKPSLEADQEDNEEKPCNYNFNVVDQDFYNRAIVSPFHWGFGQPPSCT